jgi:TonB family protein
MTESSHGETPQDFSRNIMTSLALHFAVVLVIFFQAVLIPQEPLDLRDAIRVDVVDLPKKIETLPEPAPPEPAPAPAPTPAPPPEAKAPEVKTPEPQAKSKPKAEKINVKKAQSHAMDKLKQMSALEKLKQEIAESKKPKTAEPVRGNQVSAGNSLTGLARIDFDRYLDSLKTKVNSNLSIPEWLAGADLRAQVQVLIDERGYVTKRTIKKSSNNEVFDAKVLEAIDASSPLPPPPDRLRGLLSTSGITFNFPQ